MAAEVMHDRMRAFGEGIPVTTEARPKAAPICPTSKRDQPSIPAGDQCLEAEEPGGPEQ
jgi:hypothetical protein